MTYSINGNQKLMAFYIEPRVKTTSFTIKELVNDMTIINQNATGNITVNNVVLIPGQEFNIGGNQGEINFQDYNVNVAAGATGVQILVLLKRYINLKELYE